MGIRVFISHSSLDVETGHALADLLRSSLGLSVTEIRCTSVDGHGLHAGADTVKELQHEITAAAVFIGLVSTASLESTYALFEMGARWGAAKPLIPLLLPGATANDLPGPLAGLTALRCDSEAALHQLVIDLAGTLDVQPASPAAYLDELRRLSTATSEVPAPQPAQLVTSRAPTELQATLEAEVRRLERLLNPLPPSHLQLLKRFSKGPQVVRHTEERDSLSNLRLIRFLGRVNSKETLWEASSEAALRECLAHRRSAELPQLVGTLSQEERAFLRLFLLPELSGPGGFSREHPLPHNVYATQWSLCQKELVQRRPSTEPATEIYALAADAIRVVETDLGSPAVRTELVVDLNAVWAVNSSGGGAG